LAQQALFSWCEEVSVANWNTPNDLKTQYRNASILTDRRVVFNIHGNSFRLVVDVEYRLKIVFIVWVGTHRSRKSEILSGKRKLNLAMIRKIREKLHIPAEVLTQAY